MFTGLVETVGSVSRLEALAEGRRIEVEAPSLAGGVAIGDSLAVNGCCLTVVAVNQGRFAMEVVPETLHRTTIGELHQGDPVNLERALAVGERLGGHLVQGHVDAVGIVHASAAEGQGRRVTFAIPKALLPFVAEKGSIAVDGVSLTVTAVKPQGFEAALIPHTLEHTVAKSYRRGRRVNIEVDIVARYVARLIEAGIPEKTSW